MKDTLVFGLGNPGSEYEKTYHNVGLLALQEAEKALEERGFSGSEQRAKHFWSKKYGDANIVLARTDENASLYMNQSGQAIKEAMDYFNIPFQNVVILHDDSDLLLGECRLEKGRGAAGHHGVESVIEILGTNDFWRGRIGIRPKEEARRQKAEELVLKRISKDDEHLLQEAAKDMANKLVAMQTS